MELPEYQPTSWQRGIQKIAGLPAFSAILARTLHRIDPVMLRWTANQQTATTWLTGLPVIWLTTTGARSRKPHKIPLVGIPCDRQMVVIASNFGSDRYPSWYYNLKANPEALISFNGTHLRCQAQEIVSPEYDALWQKAVQMYPGYASYKDRANRRHIPIFSLTPLETV
jgi:deazaflavin-dependent oxidoreductase (nitroreductase family)